MKGVSISTGDMGLCAVVLWVEDGEYGHDVLPVVGLIAVSGRETGEDRHGPFWAVFTEAVVLYDGMVLSESQLQEDYFDGEHISISIHVRNVMLEKIIEDKMHDFKKMWPETVAVVPGQV